MKTTIVTYRTALKKEAIEGYSGQNTYLVEVDDGQYSYELAIFGPDRIDRYQQIMDRFVERYDRYETSLYNPNQVTIQFLVEIPDEETFLTEIDTGTVQYVFTIRGIDRKLAGQKSMILTNTLLEILENI
ncbi:hypothetical protein ACX3VT_01480 [Aerococcus sanguinicola]